MGARLTPRRGGVAAIAGGALWLALWAHQLAAHGTAQVNEMELVLGLTWMDSGRLFVVPFLLFLAAVLSAAELQRGTPVDRAALGLTAAALVGLAVATALQFWLFEWGSYAETFQQLDRVWGGRLVAVLSLVLTGGAVLLAFSLARARAIPWWAAAEPALGAPTTLFLSPAFPFPGVAWTIFGLALLRRGSV